MLRIETPSARTTIAFSRMSPPSKTTPFRSSPTIVMSCFAGGTRTPPGYVPRASTIRSPGCARSTAACTVGASAGTWMRRAARSASGTLGRGDPIRCALARALERRADEAAEEWRGPCGPRLELRVELACDEPRVLGQLDDLDEASLLD